MKNLKILQILKDNAFGLAVLASAALALAFPKTFIKFGDVELISLVVPAIQLIMFGMGTTLSLADFLRVAKKPWAVGIGVGLQFIVMPLTGLALAKCLGFSGELAAGCVLVGSVAGGTASNVIAFLAKADVALSVSMTCISTLLSPLLTPLAMKLLAGRFVEIDAMKMMIEILKIVVIPVVAGAVAHKVFEGVFLRHKARADKILSIVSMGGICFTLVAITAKGAEGFRTAGVLITIAAVLHNLIGYVCGYWFTRLAGKFLNLDRTTARTVAIEVAMQNSGMASALAIGVLGSAIAALPANVFSIWMNFAGSIVANYFRRHEVR